MALQTRVLGLWAQIHAGHALVCLLLLLIGSATYVKVSLIKHIAALFQREFTLLDQEIPIPLLVLLQAVAFPEDAAALLASSPEYAAALTNARGDSNSLKLPALQGNGAGARSPNSGPKVGVSGPDPPQLLSAVPMNQYGDNSCGQQVRPSRSSKRAWT